MKKLVTSEMTEEECREVDSLIGFPDAAVDRIVPEQKGTDRLEVAVEPFYEWVVDVRGVRNRPTHPRCHLCEGPYALHRTETVYGEHRPCRLRLPGLYYGVWHSTGSDRDPSVSETLRGALEETGEFLVQKHGFDPRDHQKYIEEILNRFRNPHLKDPVTRVGRSPLRKLGREDRLLGPALQMMDRGIQPNHLAVGIAAALCFDDPADPEAVKLQRMIKREGPAGTLQAIAGIARNILWCDGCGRGIESFGKGRDPGFGYPAEMRDSIYKTKKKKPETSGFFFFRSVVNECWPGRSGLGFT